MKNSIISACAILFAINGIAAESSEEFAAKNCREKFPMYADRLDCKMQDKNSTTIVALSDSHAGHLFLGLSESATDNKVSTFALSCAAPYLNISSGTHEPNTYQIRKDLYKINNAVFQFVLSEPQIKYVVLAHNPNCSFQDAVDISNPKVVDSNIALKNGMKRTFDLLASNKKNVVVLLDNPIVPYDPKLCVKRPFRFTNNEDDKCRFPRATFDSMASNKNYRDLVISVAKNYNNIKILDLSDILCDKEYCYIEKNGKFLYSDQGHLSSDGSRFVAPYILRGFGLREN